MWGAITDFFKTCMSHIFNEKLAIYYLVGIVGLFALGYIIALVASFCDRLSKIKRAQKILADGFSPEKMEAALQKFPQELSCAYSSAKNRKENPLSVFNFESCVRIPYSISFASRFVMFTLSFGFLTALFSSAFFGLGYARTSGEKFSYYLWFALFDIAIITMIGTAIAAIISSSKYKNAVKRFENFSELKALADSSQFMLPNAQEVMRTAYTKGNVDEFIESVTVMCKEGSSLASLKDAAHQLQQIRIKNENLNPMTQHRLNETVNLVIKTMATTLRNEQH